MSISVPYFQPVNVAEWVEANKSSFQPPVGNKLMFGQGQMKVMFVGGPNQRKDYHIEEGAELFYQLKGEMRVDTFDCGKPKGVVIKEGEMFLLPGRFAHSPQRFENTIGLVLERERKFEEKDCLRWYRPDGQGVLYEEWFHCTDLGVQLKPVIERFFSSEAHRTGTPDPAWTQPAPAFEINMAQSPGCPQPFTNWLYAHPQGGRMFDGEFKMDVVRGDCAASAQTYPGEVFIWNFEGETTVIVTSAGEKEPKRIQLHKDEALLTTAGCIIEVKGTASTTCALFHVVSL